MTKKQLIEQIANMETNQRELNNFHMEIIMKLIKNWIQIKPISKGKIKDRISFFAGKKPCKNLILNGGYVGFLGDIEIDGSFTYNSETLLKKWTTTFVIDATKK